MSVSRKFSAVSIAVFVLAGTLAGITSASAATPYTACSPAKAKIKIGSTKYKCLANPGNASKKKVWVSKQCISANRNYKSAVSISGSNEATTTMALNAANRQITLRERQIVTAQKNVDTWSKNMLSYPKNPTETEKKQIATVQAGIDLNKQRVIDAQADISNLQAQIQTASAEDEKNAAGILKIKASVVKACK